MCQDRVRRGLSGRPFVKLKPDWTGPNMTTEPAHEASWVIPQQIQILFALSRCVEFSSNHFGGINAPLFGYVGRAAAVEACKFIFNLIRRFLIHRKRKTRRGRHRPRSGVRRRYITCALDYSARRCCD